jgi:hypothetical protein
LAYYWGTKPKKVCPMLQKYNTNLTKWLNSC